MLPIDDLVAFCLANPGPQAWPQDMLRRFLGGLVSSDDLVFDLRPRGVAVLADRITNPANHATLEILGGAVLPEMIELAKTRLPAGFAGFEVPLPTPIEGLEPYYEVFGMLHDSPSSVSPPPAGLCTIVTDRDEGELYALLKKSFAQNLDTNIPAFDEWQTARRAPSRSKTWGIWEDKRLVAFLNLSVPRQIALAELRTVGVDPEYRGRGYATALIRRAMGYVTQLEIPKCALTVATQNARALELYRRLGFREIEHQRVYRWRR